MTQFTTPYLLYSVAFLLVGCGTQKEQIKIDKAEQDAAYIMSHLDKPEVLTHFSAVHFPPNQLAPLKSLVSAVGPKCDWANRRGKFVDFYSISNNGKNSIAYIYECFLKCDSLRFVMRYDLEDKEPQLINFQIEPLEKPNSMIIHPEKQLLYRK